MAGKTVKTPETDAAAHKPTVDLNLIQNPFAVEEAEAKATMPKRARNDAQLAMDAVAQAVHERWVAAGKPAAWNKIPVSAKAKYAVNPEDASAYRALIKRSAEFLNLRPKLGDPAQCNRETCGVCARIRQAMMEQNANPENENPLSDEDLAAAIESATGGHELIVFTIIDKRPRTGNGPEQSK